MSLRENPLLKKMIATGEERMSKLAASLLTNEKLMGKLKVEATIKDGVVTEIITKGGKKKN